MSLENAVVFIDEGNTEGLETLLSQHPDFTQKIKFYYSEDYSQGNRSRWTEKLSSYNTLLSMALEEKQIECAICIFEHNPIIDIPYTKKQTISVIENDWGNEHEYESPVSTVYGEPPLQSVLRLNHPTLIQSAFNYICRNKHYANEQCRSFILKTLMREHVDISLFDADEFKFLFGELPENFEGSPDEFKQWLKDNGKNVENVQITQTDCLRDLMADPILVTKLNLEKFHLSHEQLQDLYQHYAANSQIRAMMFEFRPEIDPVAHQALLLQKEAERQARAAAEAEKKREESKKIPTSEEDRARGYRPLSSFFSRIEQPNVHNDASSSSSSSSSSVSYTKRQRKS